MAEGHSLKPLLNNPEKNWNYPALTFYGVGNVAVRGPRYRLIQYEDGSQEFYDMLNDPNEWHNHAGEEKYRDDMMKLQKHIPEKWASLSEHSAYNFNTYFKSLSESDGH